MKTIILTLALVNLLITPTLAQNQVGVLRGQILKRDIYGTDSLASQKQVYDTTKYEFGTVRLVDSKSNSQSTTVTDQYGYFIFTNVPRGVYRLYVSDQILGEKYINVSVRYPNNRLKPILVDRASSKLIVLPKYMITGSIYKK